MYGRTGGKWTARVVGWVDVFLLLSRICFGVEH